MSYNPQAGQPGPEPPDKARYSGPPVPAPPYDPAAYAPSPYAAPAPYGPVYVVGQQDSYAERATAGLVLGIIAVVFSVVLRYLAFCTPPVAIAGVALAAIGLRSTTRRGQAIAGLIASIAAIAITSFWWIRLGSALNIPT